MYNVIYIIQYDRCSRIYCGETSRKMRNRMYEHIASVKNSNKIHTPVSKHFSTETHTHKDTKFSVIQWLGNRNDPDMTQIRRKVENGFIWNIPTVAPIGINQFI